MRRLTAWIGGAVGGITAYRFFRRRPAASPGPSPEPAPEAPDERADELRAKLAESRTADPVPEESPSEVEIEDAQEPESPDERRRRVHEEGRAALDEMKPE
jgi:hypothetical protein